MRTMLLLSCLCSVALAAPPLGIAPTALTESEQLQAVVDRGGPIVFVPKGTYQQDVSLRLRSNLTVLCEEGATIEAAPGAFLPVKGPDACLVVLEQVENIAIHNCRFIMRKADYGTRATPVPPYEPGEWRHAIYVAGSKNIALYNVTANSSGGDGLYIGAFTNPDRTKIPSTNVTARRCVFENNHRQGVSMTSCMGDCLLEDCVFTGTKGTSPQAGFDAEPEDGDAVEVTVRRCQSIGNRGPAYMVGLFKSIATSPPSKVVFSDCTWTAVPNDQPHFRLAGVLNHEVPNGYLLPRLPAGTLIQWDALTWKK